MNNSDAVGDSTKFEFTIPDQLYGQRVDKALATLCEGHSRSTVQTWIKQGLVSIDEETPRQKDKVYGGEHVEIDVPEIRQGEWEPQNISLDIVFEDDDMLVINKPAGLVVHPGAGNPDGTLLNALLYHFPNNRSLARAGIVHRLDKDTSGLMVVAKSEAARLGLIDQLVDHSLHREYLAMVNGRVISGNTVEEPIGRDKHDRRKMTVSMMGKEAVTHYRVDERFRNHTLLRVQLETGRTHQIRVHMAYVGFPLVGDPVYGRRLGIPADSHPDLEAALRSFRRQALHATRIEYQHPIHGELQSWQRDLPEDMQTLVAACTADYE
ncbi:pseudouridine synthase [Arenicella chitinivorans]|uniref:Pseudouridine synthase n=1 Tax=Arenicella chitinivorans TaxID=1329800 RepID=A0A918RYE1_9GAMM|nr:23S rRNA pseudouridine(1911/1915/1917) synthase RluD [Arenicella chitinivorans]GHA17219.1 pseudouridine synthase [Arenicella chitinivorans]